MIFSAYQLAKISWTQTPEALAAITIGPENNANSTTVNLPTSDAENKPDVAMSDSGNVIVVWADETTTREDIKGRIYDIEGNAYFGNEFSVATTVDSNAQYNPAVAMDKDGNFVIVWEGVGTGDSDGIFLQAYQADGTQIGTTAKLVNTTGVGGATPESFPDIAIDYNSTGLTNNTRFVVTWRSTADAGSTYDIYAQRFDVDFTQSSTEPSAVGSEISVNSASTTANTRSAVAMNTLGEFMITWNDTDIYYQAYAFDGTALGSNTALMSQVFANLEAPDIAADKAPRPDNLDDDTERRFIIAYPDQDAGSNELSAEIITCSDPNATNGTDTDVTCTPNGLQLVANDNTTVTPRQSPNISADYLGNFTVTWSERDGATWDIYSQSFNYQGKRIGSNVALTTGASVPEWSAVGMNSDGFYATARGEGNNIKHQSYITEVFKTETEDISTPISVHTGTNVDAAVAPNGNIAFVYRTTGPVPAEAVRLTLKRYDPSASPSYIDVKEAYIISASSGANNPSISFFKDTTGNGVGNFVVTWEDNSSGTKNVYYQLFDEAGDPLGAATPIRASSNTQEYAEVSAGQYLSGMLALQRFAVIWNDVTDQSIQAAYHSGSFDYYQLYGGCTDCRPGGVDMDPDTTDIVYAWEDSVLGVRQAFIHQATGGTPIGSDEQVPLAGTENVDPDVAFVSGGRYVVTFTGVSGADSDVFAKLYAFYGGGPVSAGLRYPLTQYSQAEARDFATTIAADTNSLQFLVVWGDSPISAEDMIYGQFLQFTGGGTYGFEPFGPTFRINSTINSSQILPSVDMNERGQASVAWEGNFESTGGNDSSITIYQLLQSPLVQLGADKFEPLAQQEVQAGGQFLDVPTNITFPSVPVDITQDTVQEISVRDAIYGGDVKYVEVQDATGVDFTLTIQADDFFAAADRKAYIKNDEHFRVKNWDNDLTDIDVGDCDDTNTPTDADLCFQTVESTNTPTAFTLNAATQSYTFIDTQQVLAEKTGTTNNEIGRWRIFPEFEITVPPFIAPGTHSAEITFTLT